MTLLELTTLVQHMRQAQKSYQQDRTQTAMRRMVVLEKRVDEVLAAIEKSLPPRPQQAALW